MFVQVGRSCNWEDFPGRGDIVESLKIRVHSPHERYRRALQRQERQLEVRRRYSVRMPSASTWNKLLEDFPRVTGRKLNWRFPDEELMSFWRQNKEAYDFREAEESRELAFFHRRAMEGPNHLRRQLCELWSS